MIEHQHDQICAKLQDTKQGTKYAIDNTEREKGRGRERGEHENKERRE